MARRTRIFGNLFQEGPFNLLGSDRDALQFTDAFGKMVGMGVTNYNHRKVRELIDAGFVENPHVYAVINNAQISSQQIPWYVYTVKDQVEFKRFKAFKDNRDWDQALAIAHKAVDLYKGPPTDLTRLLERPNGKQTFAQFFSTCLGMDMLTGNQYIYGVISPLESHNGRILELIPTPSQFMKINAHGWEGTVDNYQLQISPEEAINFKKDEICHIAAFNPNYTYQDEKFTLPLYGQSPLTPICKVIRQSNDGFLAQMRLVQNGHPLGVLTNSSELAMTEDERKEAERVMLAAYGGATNKGKIHLSSAKLQWLELGMNSADLQLKLMQDADLGTICRIYLYPEPNITGKNANFNTSKEAEKQKWNDALLPRFNVFRDHLNTFLEKHGMVDDKTYIDYDHRAVPSLQQDLDRRHKMVMEQMEHGLIRKPEANRLLGIEDVPAEHDKEYFITNQVRKMSDPAPGTAVNNSGNDTGNNSGGSNPAGN